MSNFDVYFEEEYGKIYENYGDGKVEVFEYESQFGKVHYLFLTRKIDNNEFNMEEEYFDIITPYGYGGPLVLESSDKEKLIEEFINSFEDYCKKNNIVSEFIRFHPLEKNHKLFTDKDSYKIEKLWNTVVMDIYDKDMCWKNMKSNTRNIIRNFDEENTDLIISKEKQYIEEFINIYNKTMEKNDADDYYYFDKFYFLDILDKLENKVELFNIVYKGEVVSASFVLIGNEYIHYHLSATNPDYYYLNCNNYLLYEIALWGQKKGYKKFHLGGGTTASPKDGLFRFKRSMSKKNETLDYYIGKKIYDNKIYNELKEKHLEDIGENNSDFFPEYRA